VSEEITKTERKPSGQEVIIESETGEKICDIVVDAESDEVTESEQITEEETEEKKVTIEEAERKPSLVRKPSSVRDKSPKTEEASEYVRKDSKRDGDKMPAPIPTYSEPRIKFSKIMDSTKRGGEQSKVHVQDFGVRASYEHMKRRYYERAASTSSYRSPFHREGADFDDAIQVTEDVIGIDRLDFRPAENSKKHQTFHYELLQGKNQTPVFRRGQTFSINLLLQNREFDEDKDNMYLNFYTGPNPSVPKRTRVALPVSIGRNFERIPHQWDIRVTNMDKKSLKIEVYIPASCPVGIWHCVVETSVKDAPAARVQYRCQEDIYVIFNPFNNEDSAFIDDDAERHEYVINDSGKVYTGGYRNVRGRPWIYGQFDDCVLPAACVLLEMSGLPHAERGNPVKVVRALASMIKSSQVKNQSKYENATTGLIVPRFEENYGGGNSPHLWTGSVQIIEEFLKGGATPVKYGHCWVMAALMTSLCRTLGLPARPVTGYISAQDSQDTLTIDRYIDRYGDVLEQGPKRDQSDALWVFHAWCDVWMHRSDKSSQDSGWQAVDPCSTYKVSKDTQHGLNGPCPVNALRQGDVGQKDDVDAFYASLNSYVRYFYEDDESGWGYSPFRQFRFPVCRYILTKSVGVFDNEGESDCDDLSKYYLAVDRPESDKFTVFNSCRGLYKNAPAFEYQAAAFHWMEFNPTDIDQRKFDVSFELKAPKQVLIGQALTIPVVMNNSSGEQRTIHSNICTRSNYYTGALGPYLKRSSTQLTLEKDHQETLTLTLDPWDYEDKLVDMSYVKITVTCFVQETGQSFVDEFDFRFNKPWLKIEVSEMKVGEECEATFSFTNPLETTLTDCYIAMEVSGSVRPRIYRVDREIAAHETFTSKHTFMPRSTGERRLVACFTSRQLVDIVGQKPVTIVE